MAPKEKLPDLEEMPEILRKNLIKLMASENLDYAEALDRAGLLLEPNSEAYKKAMEADGNTRYKSRFLSELNSARAKWKATHDKMIRDASNEGFQAGQESVRENEYAWHVPCPSCGRDMVFTSRDTNFEQTCAVLHDAFKNWRHVECIPASGG